MADPSLENRADGPMQRPDLMPPERGCTPCRPDAGPEERFVRVDVPDACDLRLVQKEGLDLRGRRAQPAKHLRGEDGLKRLDPEREGPFHALRWQEEDLAELPDITIGQDAAPAEEKASVRVLVRPEVIMPMPPQKLSCHPQPDDETVLPKIEDEILPASAKGPHPAAHQRLLDLARCLTPTRKARLCDLDPSDSAPHNPPHQVSPNHLDLWKLWHRVLAAQPRFITAQIAGSAEPKPMG
jgi:hypothetical protein